MAYSAASQWEQGVSWCLTCTCSKVMHSSELMCINDALQQVPACLQNGPKCVCLCLQLLRDIIQMLLLVATVLLLCAVWPVPPVMICASKWAVLDRDVAYGLLDMLTSCRRCHLSMNSTMCVWPGMVCGACMRLGTPWALQHGISGLAVVCLCWLLAVQQLS